jgi:hypothetical protein
MIKPLGRRALLRGAGGVAIGLPFLGAMLQPLRTYAGPRDIPKRFITFFTPNGTVPDRWTPTGSETDFALSEILSPLEPHKSDLLVLEGVDMVTAMERSGGNNGHDIGVGHALVARPLVEGPSGFGEFGHLWDGSAGGISIDQHIARRLSERTTSRFQSLVFGRNCDIRQAIPTRISWSDVFEPVHPMQDPAAAFDRIFGGGVEDPARLEEIQAQRRSVLNAVMDDYRRLNARLGADDRRRLDQHLTAISDVEREIASIDVTTACEIPDRPTVSSYPDAVAAHMRLAVMAMSCELTPVVTFQWTTGQGGITYSWLGHSDAHHTISHEGDSNTTAQQQLTEINTWYAEQLASLLADMKSVTEADGGTLLDHSVVFWANEIGKGNDHRRNDMPYVLAGKAGGSIRPGRYLHYGNESHSDLFVGIMNALDIEDTTFGDPEFCTGPIGGLG